MEIETASVHQRLLLTFAGGISATLFGFVALAELLASSQFLDSNKMDVIEASNEKRKSKSRKCQTTRPIDGEENENENNDSDNELGEDQDVHENGEEGKNAPTKDGANGGGGEDGSNDNGDGGSENSGEGGGDEEEEEENDDGGSDENNEDNNEDDDEVDEEDVEEDNFEGEEDDEETLPPPKKRKK